MPDVLLTLHTRRHMYAVLHRHEIELRYLGAGALPGATDSRNRPLLNVDLGPLLDPADRSIVERRCAMIVPLRRRTVALLCDRVSELHDVATATILPLPSLLRQRLAHTWIIGLYQFEDELIPLLDLHQIALDVLRQTTVVQGDPV